MHSADQLINEIRDIDGLKTWSFVVTLFGDLGAGEPIALSGKQVGSVLSRIGIKPEATRVALHRLKNDGWIETSKSGRETLYSLSRQGLADTRAVYGDVYRETIKYPDGWVLYLLPPDQSVSQDQSGSVIEVQRNLFLAPKTLTGSDQSALVLELNGAKPPAWFADQLVPPHSLLIAEKLSRLSAKALSLANQTPAFDLAVIRLLILHQWRKMALRETTWAHIWLQEEGGLAECHRCVSNLLKQIPNPGAERLFGT